MPTLKPTSLFWPLTRTARETRENSWFKKQPPKQPHHYSICNRLYWIIINGILNLYHIYKERNEGCKQYISIIGCIGRCWRWRPPGKFFAAREVDLSMTIGAHVGLWFMPTDGWYSTHPYTVCIDGSLSYAAYWGCMDGERRFNLVVVAPRHS